MRPISTTAVFGLSIKYGAMYRAIRQSFTTKLPRAMTGCANAARFPTARYGAIGIGEADSLSSSLLQNTYDVPQVVLNLADG